jgi:hypothetical protein
VSTVIQHGIKCRIFDNQSNTTQMALNPLYSGNPVTKSINKASQGFCGTARGRSTLKFICLLVWTFGTLRNSKHTDLSVFALSFSYIVGSADQTFSLSPDALLLSDHGDD